MQCARSEGGSVRTVIWVWNYGSGWGWTGSGKRCWMRSLPTYPGRESLRFSTRLEHALKRLSQQVEQGRVKDRSKIERRLGRIQAWNAQVTDLYEMKLTERDGRLVLNWNPIEDRRAWREAREGAYLL